MSLIIPEGYRNVLGGVENTEKAIKAVKDMFQDNLSAQLALLRVTAPMVVMSGMGLNDDLNGVESPVSFAVKDMSGRHAEVVHSLAKWKRMKLAQMNVQKGRGIYTDMNALRPDEELDNIRDHVFRQGDVVETIISCENGELINLRLECTLPTYYSRELTVHGTRGLYHQDCNAVILDGPEDDSRKLLNNINSAEKYYDEYLPEIWKQIDQKMLETGHGGYDYLMFYSFIEALRDGEEMPIDVYDAAAWMSITYLTEQSIVRGGASIDIPDFTKGAYKTRAPRDVVKL